MGPVSVAKKARDTNCMVLRVSVSALLLALVLSLSVLQVSGTYFVETNNLNVLSPSSIEGKYDIAIGSFGRPAYAGSILGALKVPKKGANSCTDFSKFGITFQREDSDYRHSPIALIESSGECDFAWKVYNAQKAGAVGAFIVDSVVQPLDTLANGRFAIPPTSADYVSNITIPSALINKTMGDLFKRELTAGAVNVKLEWTEAPKDPVVYELWTISQDKCGPRCDTQVHFMQDFRGIAEILEKGGYTVFSPHYIVWYCPPKYINSKECKAQCINNGRYCSPDPEDDFQSGYDGKDVVMENLRQLCLHKLLLEQGRPWIWWDYVADFEIRCSMKNNSYDKDCGNMVASSLGLDVTKVNECVGDPDADVENQLLKAELDGQTGDAERGDITITPTLVINSRQYKGKLEHGAVLRALCAQFVEGEEPPLCLRGAMETDECLVDNGGCWMHDNGLITACRDTYRGRVCECPYYQGIQWEGDGYTKCEPVGLGRCKIDNAGCWQETQGNVSFSACSSDKPKGCECPEGFTGDGVTSCVNRNECAEKTHCQCPDCTCSDTWGSYECSCSGDRVYLRENDQCVRKMVEQSNVFWFSFAGIGLAAVAVLLASFLVYKYKVRSYMDSKIRSTLAQYMPLDSSNQDIYRHLQDEG